eukprot:15408419-Alexandrium_andersonii.AAC.1
MRAARGPAEPSDEERQRRECAHVPFRSWRTRCARGQMPRAPRASIVGGRREVPEVGMDYWSLSKDADSESLAVL